MIPVKLLSRSPGDIGSGYPGLFPLDQSGPDFLVLIRWWTGVNGPLLLFEEQGRSRRLGSADRRDLK
jgi:hypothetical protein